MAIPERHKGKARAFARATSYFAFLSACGSVLAYAMGPTFEAMEKDGFAPSMMLSDMHMPEWAIEWLGINEIELSPSVGINASWQLLGLSMVQATVSFILYRVSR